MLSHKFISFLRINTANVNVKSLISSRNLSTTSASHCEVKEVSEDLEEAVKEIDPRIDRTKIVQVEVSQRYLKSPAYNTTYGDKPVWLQYRRNFKGLYPPNKTRKTCVRKGLISTGNPCPICRDEYLVLDHNNVDLLQQFISPQTGKVCLFFHLYHRMY